jgi:hypothetical protein
VRLCEGTGLRSHIIRKTSQAVNKFGPHSSKKCGKNFDTKMFFDSGCTNRTLKLMWYEVWQKSNATDFLLTMNFILFTN